MAELDAHVHELDAPDVLLVFKAFTDSRFQLDCSSSCEILSTIFTCEILSTIFILDQHYILSKCETAVRPKKDGKPTSGGQQLTFAQKQVSRQAWRL